MNNLLSVSVLSVSGSDRRTEIQCYVYIAGQSVSVAVPSEPISFSGIRLNEDDKLSVTVSDRYGDFGKCSIRLCPLFKSTSEIDSEFALARLNDSKSPGKVRLRIEKQDTEPFQPSTLKPRQEDMRSMLRDSYKAREDLQKWIKTSADKFKDHHNAQADIIRNTVNELERTSDALKEKTETVNRLTHTHKSQEAKITDLKNKLETAQTDAKYFSEEAKASAHCKEMLEDSWIERDSLKKKLEASTDEFSQCSKDQDSYISTVCEENSELRSKILELEREINRYKDNEERLNTLVLKLQSEIAVLRAKIGVFEERQFREKELESTVNRLEKAKSELKEALDQLKLRSKRDLDSALSRYEDAMGEIRDLKEEINELVADNKDKQIENRRLAAQGQDMKAELVKLQEISRAQEDLKQINEQLLDQNDMLHKATEEQKKTIKALNEQIKSHEKAIDEVYDAIKKLRDENNKKDAKIIELKSVIKSMSDGKEVYFPDKDDPVDIAIADYLNTQRPSLKVPLRKEETGVYTFGTKRVLVKLEQGKLIFRVGGGYLQIEDFCEMYSAAELDKYENKLREQAQKVRKNLYGKYANSLITEKNSSPIRHQPNNGYSTFYAIQDRKSMKGSMSPKSKKRINRSKSNKYLSED